MSRNKALGPLNEEELIRLHEISRAINSSLNLEEVVQFILKQGAKLIGARHGSLILLEAKDLVIRSWIGKGWTKKRREHRLRVGEGITGRVAKMGRPYVCNDTSSDPYYFPLFPEIKSELAVPLRSRGAVIGVLNVDSARVNAFSARHVRLLSLLGEQATTAIENARLHGTTSERLARKVKDLEALHEVAAAVSAALINTQETLQLVLEKAFELTGARYGNILMKVPNKNEIEIVVDKGSTEEKKHARQKFGEGVTGTVAKKKRARLIGDITKSPYDKLYMAFIPGMRSELAVPMLKGQELIGVINVESPKVNAFDADDQGLLESFASIAVAAIENARLFERTDRQLERKIDEVEALRKIDLIISSELNINKALKSILKEGLQLIQSRHIGCQFYGHIQMVDKSDGSLVFRATKGVPRNVLDRRVKIGKGEKGLTSIVAEKKEALLVNDLSQRPWSDLYLRIIPNMRSELVIPLLGDGKTLVGVFNVESPAVDAFDEDDKELLTALGRQAGIAIRNAEQYETLKTTYETVRTIASSLDIKEALGLLLENGIKRSGAHSGSARLLSLDGLVLTPLVRRGQETEKSKQAIRVGEGIVGACAKQKGFIRVPDVKKDDRYREFNPDTRSELAVPLLKGEVFFGVLNFEHPLADAFDEEDVRFIQALADQAAVVIEINRIIEAVKAAKEQAAASNAMAWLGIVGATWQHDVTNLVHAVEVGIERLVGHPLSSETRTILDEVKENVAAIKMVAPELPVEAKGEPVGLGTIIHAALEQVKVHESAEVHREIPEGLPPVFGSPQWFTIVFKNVFQNAKDAMGSEGKLMVRAIPGDGMVSIEVSNTGPGIPAGVSNRLFKERIVGTRGRGYGLLLAKTVLLNFGGDITLVDCGPGNTMFRLTFRVAGR